MDNKAFQDDCSSSNQDAESEAITDTPSQSSESMKSSDQVIEISNFIPQDQEATPKTMIDQNLVTVVECKPERLNLIVDKEAKDKSSCENLVEDKFVVSWSNLDYVVGPKWYKLSSQRKLILNNLNGSFESGKLTAILGPSGAGKSTLIEFLTGKQAPGLKGTTRVTYNNSKTEHYRRTKLPLKIVTIPQKDHLLDSLTVMETFMYASKIKNAHLRYQDEENVSSNQTSGSRQAFNHAANVQRVIKQLNLSSCASIKCGKLSGGQYKRVSIGQELLSRPDIMILDEPTSGLDSTTCYQTVMALRKLTEDSQYPLAIVSTIHQPDVEVFGLFHKAYVLAPGGRAIYEGPTSSGMIFDTVSKSLDLVEARRAASPATNRSNEDLKEMRKELQSVSACGYMANAARLIVKIASDEDCNELTNALNDIQIQNHLAQVGDSSTKEWRNSMSSGSDSALSTGSSDGCCLDTSRQLALSVQSLMPQSEANNLSPKPPKFNYATANPQSRQADLDKLLRPASSNRRTSLLVHLRHVRLHVGRSWTTIVRDPMLCSVQVALHILVPLLISYAFQRNTYEACPRVKPFDVINETYRPDGNIFDELNAEVRGSFENVGYMFFQSYVIIFAAICMTSLTYPLTLHVLLKEYRNGWYSTFSYFLGRTMADLPLPMLNVTIAIAISYTLTGQPGGDYYWRFWSANGAILLGTLVGQTLGLMFGALLMQAPQSAVFVAPAATAPLVVVSGVLVRVKSMPWILQIASQLSFFTHLMNGFIVSRYGFNRCPCNSDDFLAEPSHSIPHQTRLFIDVWAETFKSEYPAAANVTDLDVVGSMLEQLDRVKVFRANLTSCEQVKPFAMLDYQLEDADLKVCFLALGAMLILFRWLTYTVLAWKISSSM